MDKTLPHIIITEQDIKICTEQLVSQCSLMKSVYKTVGQPPLRTRTGGFEGLARIIIGQQLSIPSANSIWARFSKKLGKVTIKNFQKLEEEELRACGLSRPKIKTLNAVCIAVNTKELNFKKLEEMAYEDVSKTLIKISGIGPWTADIYVMFCMGHPDAWAPGDLALQYAVQDILSLEARPATKEMISHAKKWQPWRGVAARLLWSYYNVMKESKSGAPV